MTTIFITKTYEELMFWHNVIILVAGQYVKSIQQVNHSSIDEHGRMVFNHLFLVAGQYVKSIHKVNHSFIDD